MAPKRSNANSRQQSSSRRKRTAPVSNDNPYDVVDGLVKEALQGVEESVNGAVVGESKDEEGVGPVSSERPSKKSKVSKGKGKATKVPPESDDEHAGWDEEEPEVDETNLAKEVQQVESKAEACRKKYFPHLRKLDRKDYISLDLHSPASFRIIDGGEATVQTASDPDALDRFQSNVLRIFVGRKNLAGGEFDPNIATRAARNRLRSDACDPAEWTQRILDGVPPGTDSVLGRKEFLLSDLEDMSGFTEPRLLGWIIYFGIIRYKNGKLKSYVGKSTNQDGGGERVLRYELGKQYADQGLFHSCMSGGFGFALLHEDVDQAWLRPLWVADIPESDADREELSKFVDAAEGMFVDYCCSITYGTGTIAMGSTPLDVPAMVRFSRELAPKDRDVPYEGINKVSPFCQGSGVTTTGGVCKVAQEILEQGSKLCPIDDVDMTVVLPDGEHATGKNFLRTLCSWFTAKRVCYNCCRWMLNRWKVPGEKSKWPLPEDMAELRTMRVQAHAYRAGAPMQLDEVGQVDCPLCEKVLKQAEPGEVGRLEKGGKYKETYRFPANNNSAIPCLKPYKVTCRSCQGWLSVLKQKNASPARKVALKELKTADCTLERARQLYQQHKPADG
ncbi:hypothetical protein LTR37_013705 [Vermiconidia calcicola]|uniref:Uncharacterized protein n=1 Tax=Vermiconidia calcicola TaxID=1690605 RepID=A0ACC3MVV1_9PEZI|nr:hypothetical protein LTR37_013705 [Vermiconidia calcicola]